MVRMGHDSERAALIYLHSSDKRQRALADAVAKAARAELAQSKKAKKRGRSGTRMARNLDDCSKTERCSRLGLIWGNVPGGGARPQVKRALATLSGQCRSGLRASGSSGGRSRRFRG